MEILKVNVQEMERQKDKLRKRKTTAKQKKQWKDIINKIKQLDQLQIKE